MSQEPSARDLLAPMIDRSVELEGAAFRVDRERVLASMAAVHARTHEERRGWLRYAVLAAASALVFIGGARFVLHEGGWASSSSLEVLVSEGSARQVRGGASASVASNQKTRIPAAGELDTAADSQARVRTAEGLQLELRSQTRVALGELQAKSRVQLLSGAIRCTVPHRSAAHAFQVVTPGVTVVDLGTVFTVSLDGPNQATRVSVEEGEVLVRSGSSETRVQAPNIWSSEAATPATSAPSATEPAPDTAAAPSSSAAAPSASNATSLHPAAKPAPAATLAQEAQLLRQGLTAERQGRRAAAISALTELVGKYPQSPLVPEARAALKRVAQSPPE